MLLLFLVALPTLAGCTDAPGVPGEAAPIWVHAEIPAERFASYRETSTQLAFWAGILEGSFQILAEDCPNVAWPKTALAHPIIPVMEALERSCPWDLHALKETAEDMAATGDHSELHEARNEAEKGLAALRTALSSPLGYANVSSVELLAWMMSKYLRLDGHFQDAQRTFEAVDKGDDQQEIQSKLVSYSSIKRSTSMLTRMHAMFGSAEPACRPPRYDVAADVLGHLRQLHERYGQHPPLNGSAYLNRYGFIADVLYVKVERAAEYGWWPYVLGVRSNLGFYNAYFEQIDNATLPTYGEAISLWRAYANDTRSIWTDAKLEEIEPRRMERFWEYEKDVAREIRALHALEWRFGDALCSP